MHPGSPLPLLVIFGLERTLFRFSLDTDVVPPLSTTSSGQVVDSNGTTLEYYEQVPEIFQKLKSQDIQIAVTSVTQKRDLALQLISLYGWDTLISYKEIYPHYITNQIERIQETSGIQYSNMLFFDQDFVTVADVRKDLALYSITVETGMSMLQLDEGLLRFQEKDNEISRPSYFERSDRRVESGGNNYHNSKGSEPRKPISFRRGSNPRRNYRKF